MEHILTGLANLGIGGAMAAALVFIHWHTVKTTIPQILREFREETREQRTADDGHVSKIMDALTETQKQIATTQQQLATLIELVKEKGR